MLTLIAFFSLFSLAAGSDVSKKGGIHLLKYTYKATMVLILHNLLNRI
jgi:hypothetical protein